MDQKLLDRLDLQPVRTPADLERKYPLGSIRKALNLAQQLEAELHSEGFLEGIVNAVLEKLKPQGQPQVLYDLGDRESVTGGWELTTLTGFTLIQSSYNGIVNIKAQNGAVGTYLTKKALEVGGLSTLTFSCGRGGTGTLTLVLMQNDQVVRQITVTENTQTPTARQTLDISDLSGAYRIGLRLQTASGNILNAYLAYMALE